MTQESLLVGVRAPGVNRATATTRFPDEWGLGWGGLGCGEKHTRDRAIGNLIPMTVDYLYYHYLI